MRWTWVLAALPALAFVLAQGRTAWIAATAAFTAAFAVCAWFLCRQADRLAEKAVTDELTGLGNVRKFRDDLRREVERAQRQKLRLSLATLDIDNFKGINGKHGHAEGDAVLARVADLLLRSIRLNVDACYRIGGDEFAILLPGADAAGALEVLHRIRRSAREEPTSLARYDAGLSLGLVELQENEGADAFLRRADVQMVESRKKKGTEA